MTAESLSLNIHPEFNPKSIIGMCLDYVTSAFNGQMILSQEWFLGSHRTLVINYRHRTGDLGTGGDLRWL